MSFKKFRQIIGKGGLFLALTPLATSIMAADALSIDLGDGEVIEGRTSYSSDSSASSVPLEPSVGHIAENLSKEDIKAIELVLDKYDIRSEISASEVAEVERKKDILMSHIYEEKELDTIRKYLNDMADEDRYSSAMRDKFPFSPEEIVALRKIKEAVKEAENKPIGDLQFDIRTVKIDVDASRPIDIFVAKGYSSSILFMDETGATWPIRGKIIGDSSSFTTKKFNSDGEGEANVGIFEITTDFKQSNALVKLDGFEMPIVLRLVGNKDKVDTRVSIMIPKMGPNSRQTYYKKQFVDNSDPVMVSFLNGDKVQGAKEYSVSGFSGSAYYYQGSLYVRTTDRVISPFPIDFISNPSGYGVYKVAPVKELLVAHDGEFVSGQISSSYRVKLKQSNSIFKD